MNRKRRTLVEELTGITADYAKRAYQELLDQAVSHASNAAREIVPAAAGSVRALYAEMGLVPECEDEVLEAAYRALARKHHPDKGGDPRRMARIIAARTEIKRLREST